MRPIPSNNFHFFLRSLSPRPDITYNWKEVRDRLIVLILFFTGCRSRELCNLDNTDVILQSPDIVNFYFRNIKRGPSGKRMCPVESPTFIRYIKAWYSYRSRISDGPFLVTNNACRLYPRKIARAVKHFFPHYSPHCLRHHYALYCLHSGVPLTTLQYLLGHRNLQTTSLYLRYDDVVGSGKIWKKTEAFTQNVLFSINNDKNDILEVSL